MSNSSTTASQISKKARTFLPEGIQIDAWQKIENFYIELRDREILSAEALEGWMRDRSELQTVLQEEIGWKYIRMSCDTGNKKFEEDFNFFIEHIEPNTAPFENQLNIKLLSSPYLEQLDKEKYFIFIRGMQKQVEIFREENIPLFTELQIEEQKYAGITGVMTVQIQGDELPMPRAANLLKSNDRVLREEVFVKMAQRRNTDALVLDELFSKLVKLRNQIALNAGFSNFRDYMFAALGRFDYGIQDCMNFHVSISQNIIPLTNQFDSERKEAMHLDALKPWDMEVDPSGKPPLKPFETADELMDKCIACFHQIDPQLGEYMEIMKSMKHVDLDSRKGKAPGGYNYPLYETGVPFIFMNAAGSLRDVITMVHEGGHAVHSFLNRDLENIGFKNVPSEVAELASMSMELISMEYWQIFFPSEDELKRAKKQQLEGVINKLPWIAAIDKFQHWIYTNPEHGVEERREAWKNIFSEFGGNVLNWEGQEDVFSNTWQKQLHLYQVPFYYIEYGMAQLGAIAVWRNYKKNPQEGLRKYLDALALGYTKSIPAIYKAAGIDFNFSEEYVKELAQFVREEMEKI